MSGILHIDIETYSSEDLRTSGVYRYAEALDFEILLLSYSFGDGVTRVRLAEGEKPQAAFLEALTAPNVQKWAHNAQFEKVCMEAAGFDIAPEQWYCTQVLAAHCGLPLSLAELSALLLPADKSKLSSGTALINYFCKPCKPTNVNGGRHRNLWFHNPEKWESFGDYCDRDVIAEMAVHAGLKVAEVPPSEREIYLLDQKINSRGVLADVEFAGAAVAIDESFKHKTKNDLTKLTEVKNPKSVAQFSGWLRSQGLEVKSLAKEHITGLRKQAEDMPLVRAALTMYQNLGKTSTKKYNAVLSGHCHDGRLRGLLQFCGASRTGRWAGRLVQLQNLPQNHLPDLDSSRQIVAGGDGPDAEWLLDDVPGTLSQLIRTVLISPPDTTFAVADFSAIEARVIAWLVSEKWRMDVFRGDGKIYEASAAAMFNVPVELVTKDSEYRAKGKVSELALGYGGSWVALESMGGEKMGLTQTEMKSTVKIWRKANASIVEAWASLEKAAIRAVLLRERVETGMQGIFYEMQGHFLTCRLPSGRRIMYPFAKVGLNKWQKQTVQFAKTAKADGTRIYEETYGGKLTENIVQAIARDLLAFSMLNLDGLGFRIVFHVHDEAVAEVSEANQESSLSLMCSAMSVAPKWAEDMPLAADGYLTPYYKKD